MTSRSRLGRAFVGDVFNFADINCRDARGLARRQIRACFRAGCEQWRGTGERGSLDRRWNGNWADSSFGKPSRIAAAFLA